MSRSNKNGSRTRKILGLSAIVTCAIGAWALWQYSQGSASALSSDSQSEKALAKSITVTTSPISIQPIERTVNAVGTLEAYEAISIRAKVEGQVKRLHCDIADRVQPNSVLLEIDSTDYDLTVRQAEKSLQVELSRFGLDEVPNPQFDITNLPSVKQALSKMQLTKSNSKRLQSILSSKAISEQEIESANMEYRWAESEYENQLLLAKSSLATMMMRNEALSISRQRQSDTIVRAPQPQYSIPHQTDSRVYAVSARSVSEGTFVRPGDELIRLVIDATLRLKAPVPERYSTVVQLGQKAHVSIAALPEVIPGIVSRINPVIEPTTRTFEVEIEVVNTDRRLKPGGFARASIVTEESDFATTVPLEAVASFAGVTKLFLVEGEQAREVQVKLGIQGIQWVEIIEPKLDPSSVVVTTGQSVLADGSRIVVRQPTSATASSSTTASPSKLN